jgi:hypothetical protein
MKEQEPIVIACGALLGSFVGERQVIYIEKITTGHWAFPLNLFLG